MPDNNENYKTQIEIVENSVATTLEICQFREGNEDGGNYVLEEDVQSVGVPTVGAVEPEDILSQGSTLTDIVKQIFQKTLPPNYDEPTSNLPITPSSTREIGSTINYTLNPSFNQNDAGQLNSVTLYRDNVELSQSSSDSSYTDSNRVVEAGSSTYRALFTYSQGDIKNNNQGDPDPNGRIEAGSIESSRSVSGSYYKWFGDLSSSPTSSSDIRSLGNSFSSSFVLNTGDSNTVMTIAIPSANTLSSVIDLDALNANITNNYELSTTLTQIEDGGGNLVSYKVYVLTLAIPYSNNHRHQITIS